MSEQKVFLSYSKKDIEYANWLAGEIKIAGVSLWMDSQVVDPRRSIQQQIAEGIESSTVFVVLLSRSSILSHWIQWEVNSALQKNADNLGIKILLIKIDDFPIPKNLSNFIYINALEDRKKALQAILSAAALKDTKKSNLKFLGWNFFDVKKFKTLVFELLKSEGRNISRPPIGKTDIGYDFKIEEVNSFETPEKTIVEVKLYSRKVGMTEIMSLDQLVQATKSNYGLLVTSSELTNQTKNFIRQTKSNIIVWESEDLIEKILKYPILAERYFSEVEFNEEPIIVIDEELKITDQLIKDLEDCPEGKEGWKLYEEICTRILTYLFVPPLSNPKIQSRRENNIDIRDAVFPNRSNDENWRFLRENYDAKYIVAEFKNYATEGSNIDKYSVLQLGDYLKPFTLGRFGILCSRKDPIESAVIKQKEYYSELQKLIIFVNDQKLKEMLLRKYKKLEPADVLFDLIDDFILNY